MDIEKMNDFLQRKFFNLNFLLEIDYKIGNLVELQGDLQDYLENHERTLHEEFVNYSGVNIVDIIVECSEYYRNYDELDNYRSFTNTIFYGLFHEFTGEILRERLDCIFEDEIEDEDEKFFQFNPDEIMEKYNDCIFKLAINKLKRNKLVNDGFLLKVSIMKCGMF